MKEITYSSNLINSAISAEQRYQAKVNGGDAIDLDTLAAEIAAKCREDSAYVKSVLTQLGVAIKKHLAQAERVSIDGFCRFEFYIEGGFDAADSTWDSEKNAVIVRCILNEDIKNVVADIVPVNTLSKVTIQLLGAQDATTYEQNILTLGNTLLVQGKNLIITQSNLDEGLYLVKDGNEYKGTITANTAGTIDATFGNDVPVGEGYTLEVRGRAGLGTSRSLVTAKISNFTVKAAA